jgi:preprotein translocase subunit SecD
MTKIRLTALFLLIIGALTGYFVYSSEISLDSGFKFKLGLDLNGGTHLTYRADTSDINPIEVPEAMTALRDTIERRINIFGVSEPVVQVEKGGVFSGEENDNRLIVELPGVTDVSEAIRQIGQTPTLEFRLEDQTSTSSLNFLSLQATTTEEIIEQIKKRRLIKSSFLMIKNFKSYC